MRARCLPSQAPLRCREPTRRRHPRRRVATYRELLAAPSRPRGDPALSFAARPGDRRADASERRAPDARSRSATGRNGHGPRAARLSYSRTARTPLPRSAAFVPSVDARSSASVRSTLRGKPRRLVGERKQVLLGTRVELPEERQDLVADEPALRGLVGRVDAVLELVLLAVANGVIAPHVEERTDDAILAAQLDPPRAARRDEAVEDRLDLIRRGVPGCPQAAPFGRARSARRGAPPRSVGRACSPASATTSAFMR